MCRVLIFVLVFVGVVLGVVFASESVHILPLQKGIIATTTTVTNEATPLPATALAGRDVIALYNKDASDTTIYIGHATVTVNNGYPLTATNPAIAIDIDEGVVVYGIVATGEAEIRTLEVK